MGWICCGTSKSELSFLRPQVLSRVSQSFDINESKYVPITRAPSLAIKWERACLIFHRQITTGTGNYKGIMEIFVTGTPPVSACASRGQMCSYRNVGIHKHSIHTHIVHPCINVFTARILLTSALATAQRTRQGTGLIQPQSGTLLTKPSPSLH